MAGTVRGSIEHFITNSSGDGVRDAFVAVFKQFDADSNMTRIASYYGTAGAGFDYSSGANPAGENAWGVWSKTAAAGTYYVHIQWGYGETVGQSGGAADAPGNQGVAISMAYDTTGTSPWNGSTNNNGADTKDLSGSGVWVANGGNLVVFPRGNGVGGTYNTAKEAMAQLYNYGSTDNRLQIVGDDDYIWIAQDQSGDASYERMLYMGPYTAATGVSPDLPLVMWQTGQTVDIDSNTGNTSNSSMTNEGGVTAVSASSTSRSFRVTCTEDLGVTVLQPNSQRTPPTYDGLPISLYIYDAQGVGTYGLLGYIDLLSIVWGVNCEDTNSGLTKAYFGYYQQNYRKLVVDWDGTTVPGSGATVTGVQF